jgi:protocatechuate 3,4-dioxygenase beta subunit
MEPDRRSSLSRRALLGLGLSATALAACCRAGGSGDRAAPTATNASYLRNAPHPPRVALAPTPHADDGDPMPPAGRVCSATADNIEGPFFKPGAPHRSELVSPGDPGERLLVSGTVMSTDCRPLSGVEMDIWQANARGEYDLDGFRFRGRLCTRQDGAFQLTTIIPGRYLNGRRYRPAHIHVKLHAPGHSPLTTQLYFEGDPYNQGDDFIRPSLIMQPRRMGALTTGRFDFVLERASR